MVTKHWTEINWLLCNYIGCFHSLIITVCGRPYVMNIFLQHYPGQPVHIPYNFVQGNRYPLVPGWVLYLQKYNTFCVSTILCCRFFTCGILSLPSLKFIYISDFKGETEPLLHVLCGIDHSYVLCSIDNPYMFLVA